MADQYGLFSMRGRNDGSSVENEDFDEEQVWAVAERKDISPKVRKSSRDSPVSAPRHVPTAARVIPRFSTPTESRVQQSAPVNIPDWSKIYRNNSSENHGFKDGSWASYGVADGDGVFGHNHGDSNEEDDYDDNDQIPPHEWLARKLARSQISSFSVCEGAGRTLKGRDLSKVILTVRCWKAAGKGLLSFDAHGKGYSAFHLLKPGERVQAVEIIVKI